ncbi:Aldehyde/histidinol dehydrogenase [Suillus tomentosus]|nr:Aldehyde/histidinol dehydrogenase [Suillus tomentosus]
MGKKDGSGMTGRPAYEKIIGFIQKAKDAGGEVLIGGTRKYGGYYDSPATFLMILLVMTPRPRLLHTAHHHSNQRLITMKKEIFGPVNTVYVYDDANYEQTLELVDNTSLYALTGSIFAADHKALLTAINKLRNAAGNVYYNENRTGAVVG